MGNVGKFGCVLEAPWGVTEKLQWREGSHTESLLGIRIGEQNADVTEVIVADPQITSIKSNAFPVFFLPNPAHL
jgi:hypothetical protein